VSDEVRYEEGTGANERSLGELFRDLSSELGKLLRQEAELAKAELRDKAGVLGRSAAEMGAGVVVSLAGVLILLHAAVYALEPVFDSPPLAALTVGGAALIVGLLLLGRARSQLKPETLAPRQTADSLRKDAELLTSGTAPPQGPHRSM
jgi:hypothetical protein